MTPRKTRRTGAILATALAVAGAAPGADAGGLAPYRVVGDAIPTSLTGRVGDPERGKTIMADRRSGNCVACHKAPLAAAGFQGDVGPSLAGVGTRLSPAQIRLRVVDISRLHPRTVMPPYYRVEGLTDVDADHAGKPILDAGQIEDLVAYLAGLKS